MCYIRSSDLETVLMHFTHYLNTVNGNENIVLCKVKFITSMKVFRLILIKLVCFVIVMWHIYLNHV